MKRTTLFYFFMLLSVLNFNAFSVSIEPFLARTHTNAKITSTVIPYRLCVPLGYDLNKSYPLVLFLHGAGQRGIDNVAQYTYAQGATLWAQTANQQKYPCFVLSPQCPNGKQWVNTNWSNGSYNQNNIPISEQLSMVLDIVDSLKREFKIDTTKIYLVGWSMGAYGTWDLVTRFPKKFAAAIICCGAGDPSKASLIGALPIRVFHSSDDPTVPVAGSRDMVNAINALGPNDRGSFYTEYTDSGHGCWYPAYATPGLVDWLFQSKPVSFTPTSQDSNTIQPKIYIQNGKIVSDFTSESGETQISVFDIKGTMISSTKSVGSELIKTDIANKGVNFVRVQNGDMMYSQKVAL